MKCTNCGKKNPEGSKFCKHCGAKFEETSVIVEPQKLHTVTPKKTPHAHKKRWFFRPKALSLIIIILVALLTGGGFFAYHVLHSITIASQHRNIGANVDVTGNKVPLIIKATKVNENTLPIKNSQSLGPEVEITPGGTLSEPITLRFKLNRTVKNDSTVIIATKETSDGKWVYLAPTISADGQYAIIQTNHLSFWKPIQSLIDFTSNFKKELINNLTGDYKATADKPSCKNEPEARKNDYQITSSDKDTLYWCFGVENNKRVLKVVNRKRYPLDLIHPGLTVVSAGHIMANLEQLARFGSGNHTVLFPHDEAVFSLDLAPDHYAYAKSSYSLSSGEAVTLDGLESALNVVSGMMPLTGVGTVLTETERYKVMDAALQGKDCYNAVANRNLANLLVDCVGKQGIEHFFGPQTIVSDLFKSIGGLANWFASAISGNVDSISQKADYTITISRGPTSPSQLGVNLQDLIGGGTADINNISSDSAGMSYTTDQSGCPVGEPTVSIDKNISIIDQGGMYNFTDLLFIINGIITNPTSADIQINYIGFYIPNSNPDLSPRFVISMTDGGIELSNKSNVFKAHSTATFKAKEVVVWYDSDGSYPYVLTPKLKYPGSNYYRPMSQWVWAGEKNDKISDKCDPNYYQIGN
jgi:uncharacterized OB-fold protein